LIRESLGDHSRALIGRSDFGIEQQIAGAIDHAALESDFWKSELRRADGILSVEFDWKVGNDLFNESIFMRYEFVSAGRKIVSHIVTVIVGPGRARPSVLFITYADQRLGYASTRFVSSVAHDRARSSLRVAAEYRGQEREQTDRANGGDKLST
jgi:hypothetical protein